MPCEAYHQNAKDLAGIEAEENVDFRIVLPSPYPLPSGEGYLMSFSWLPLDVCSNRAVLLYRGTSITIS